mgnify:CR=1 FL=1
MALKTSWFESVQRNLQDMEKLLDDLSRRKPPHSHFLPKPWQPAIDIYKTADSIVVLAELAGVGEEDIEMEISPFSLLLRGHRQAGPRCPEKKECHQLEIYWGVFEQAIHLPFPIDPDGATASFQKGILVVVLPKAKQEQTHQIRVRVV